MKFKSLILFALAALLLAACNMPGGPSADQVQTQAAETVNAQLTMNALLTPSSTNTPLATETPAATNTPAVTNAPAATSTTSSGGGGGSGCDAMAFVADVTIPDGEDMTAGKTFTKTWRLRNSGTCTWSTTYNVVFVSGSSMGGPATQALSASVVPGSTIDISVNLTAPSSNGEHTGYWALRNAAGQNFGSFYVQIEVGGASGTPGGGDGDEDSISASLVGQVRSDGTTGSNAQAGDTGSNVSVQGFVSFDISEIPDGATIEEVKVDFSDFDTDSNPFATLGCLTANFGSYFPLDASDFSGAGSVDAEWCDATELSTVFIIDAVADRLQSVLASQDELEYRLRFSDATTDSDNTADLVRFLSMRMIVTYTEP
jgi:hypothetical protein